MPNWSGALGGASTGYTTGSMFGGPVGGAIGAGIGGLFGLFKKKPKTSATGPTGDGYEDIMSRYRNFADTGGYTPTDIANFRSRASSPIKSVYAGARRDVDRQRSLQGGYSPNYTAALSRMAREQSMGISEAGINSEAALAELKNRGQLAGIRGMADLWTSKQGLPSDYQRKLGSVSSTLDLIGRGAQAVSNAFPGKFGGGGNNNPGYKVGGFAG